MWKLTFSEKLEYLRDVLIEKTICKWKGHDFIDESIATPDSGEICLICKRCGKEYCTILY